MNLMSSSQFQLKMALTLVTYRGLYDRVPFLLSLGLGAVVAFLVILLIRLARRSDLQWNRLRLKSKGRFTPAGLACMGLMAAFGVFSVHSAFMHYHSFQGRRLASLVHVADPGETEATRAINHLSASNRWGLFASDRDASLLADLNYQLAGIHFHANRLEKAEHHLQAALSARPDFVMAHYDLGAFLVEKGRLTEGITHLRAAVDKKPDFAEGHYNLGLAYWMAGAESEARRELEAAFGLDPADQQIRRLRELMIGDTAP